MPDPIATGRRTDAEDRSDGNARDIEGTAIQMEKPFENSLQISFQFGRTK